ncbi:MAG TPA: DUF805 domain-containing protein [Steroidobacteraceae bacterium]|jgi:uncharacterized membrane protein YhaH (DUF805 family)|nr:DUF805 domain-containing protein [Steroidobacteraceae bacterium]
MPGSVLRTFISFQGRISRGTFWVAALTVLALFTVLFVFLESALGRGATWLLYPPFFWAAAALAVKRLHDRALTAWRLALLIIPVIGPLWLFVSLGLRAGTKGENQYGEDPQLVDADYLTVK